MRSVVALLLCIAAGCSKADSDSVRPTHQLKPVTSIESQAKVSLVETDGDVAKVRTGDGKEFYVPAARLQDRSTLDRSDQQYTHVLSAATAAYDERPATLPEPKVRSTKEVAIEQLNINQLYLTEKTRKEVIAPARFISPWDEESGERCFPALTCAHPDCPGESSGERPYLFIVPFTPGGGGGELACPACAQTHDPATWTHEDRVHYRKFVKPYRLPKQAARMKDLDDEIRESARQSRSK